MSLVSITNAQRYTVGYRMNIAANYLQRFINNVKAPTAAQEAVAAPAIQAAVDALVVAGYYSVPSGSALVQNGLVQTAVPLTVATSLAAGSATRNLTYTVVDGVITAISIS